MLRYSLILVIFFFLQFLFFRIKRLDGLFGDKMEYFRAHLSLADAHVGKHTTAEICKSRGERWDERREYFTLMHFSPETYVCISYGANYCPVFFDISRATLVIIRIWVREKRYLIAKIAMTHKLETVYNIYICIYIVREKIF